MINGNFTADKRKQNEIRRFKVYFDNNPKTAVDAEKRVCLALKSTGQVIRLSEKEAYDIVADLAKALKWGHSRKYH